MDEVIYEEFKGTGNMELHSLVRLLKTRLPGYRLQPFRYREEQAYHSGRAAENVILRKIIHRWVRLMRWNFINSWQ